MDADLGTLVGTRDLRQSYAGYCQQHQLWCVDERSFGRTLTKMFGKDARKRLTSPTGCALPGSLPRKTRWTS
jgi:hypothetical protein